jgi:hypothetical protein
MTANNQCTGQWGRLAMVKVFEHGEAIIGKRILQSGEMCTDESEERESLVKWLIMTFVVH